MITLTADEKGFPLGKVRNVGAFHLWPVTKFQFNQFIAEKKSTKYDKKWKEEVLALNPVTEPECIDESNYEQLFMTGILPNEALEFARWMGPDYDLPTPEEWLEFYNNVAGQMFNFRLSQYLLCDEAKKLSGRLPRFLRTPLAFTLLENGVVDWVKKGNRFMGRGSPRESFFPNAWNPEKDTIQLIDTNERIFYFGFRLIKRIYKVHEFLITGGYDDQY